MGAGNQAPEVVQHRVTRSDRTLANLQAHFKVATDIERCPSPQTALNEAIADIDYQRMDPIFGSVDQERQLFRHHIQREVLRRFDTGIVSLS